MSTVSLSSRNVVKTLAILPIARILLRMISFRAATPSNHDECKGQLGGNKALASGKIGLLSESSSTSSFSEQMLRSPTSISVTFSPTNGSDQVKTSMKLGNQ